MFVLRLWGPLYDFVFIFCKLWSTLSWPLCIKGALQKIKILYCSFSHSISYLYLQEGNMGYRWKNKHRYTKAEIIQLESSFCHSSPLNVPTSPHPSPSPFQCLSFVICLSWVTHGWNQVAPRFKSAQWASFSHNAPSPVWKWGESTSHQHACSCTGVTVTPLGAHWQTDWSSYREGEERRRMDEWPHFRCWEKRRRCWLKPSVHQPTHT